MRRYTLFLALALLSLTIVSAALETGFSRGGLPRVVLERPTQFDNRSWNQTILDDYVPYTGANANVDLGMYNLTATSSLVNSSSLTAEFIIQAFNGEGSGWDNVTFQYINPIDFLIISGADILFTQDFYSLGTVGNETARYTWEELNATGVGGGGFTNGSSININVANVTTLIINGTEFGTINDSILFIYDHTGGTSIANTWTNITFDSELREDTGYSHASDSHIIVLESNSTYSAQFECSLGVVGTARYTSDWRIIKNGVKVNGSQSRAYHRTTDDGEDNGNIVFYVDAVEDDEIVFQAKCDTNSVCSTIAESCRVFMMMLDNQQGVRGEKGETGATGGSDGKNASGPWVFNDTWSIFFNDTHNDAKYQDDIGSDCGVLNCVYGVQEEGALKCRATYTGIETGSFYAWETEEMLDLVYVAVSYGDINAIEGGGSTPELYDWSGTFLRKVAANLRELKGVAMIPLENYTETSNFTFTIKNPTTEREYFDYFTLNQRCHKGFKMRHKQYLPDQEGLQEDDDQYVFLNQYQNGTFSFSNITIPDVCLGADFINYQLEIGGYYENV